MEPLTTSTPSTEHSLNDCCFASNTTLTMAHTSAGRTYSVGFKRMPFFRWVWKAESVLRGKREEYALVMGSGLTRARKSGDRNKKSVPLWKLIGTVPNRHIWTAIRNWSLEMKDKKRRNLGNCIFNFLTSVCMTRSCRRPWAWASGSNAGRTPGQASGDPWWRTEERQASRRGPQRWRTRCWKDFDKIDFKLWEMVVLRTGRIFFYLYWRCDRGGACNGKIGKLLRIFLEICLFIIFLSRKYFLEVYRKI